MKGDQHAGKVERHCESLSSASTAATTTTTTNGRLSFPPSPSISLLFFPFSYFSLSFSTPLSFSKLLSFRREFFVLFLPIYTSIFQYNYRSTSLSLSLVRINNATTFALDCRPIVGHKTHLVERRVWKPEIVVKVGCQLVANSCNSYLAKCLRQTD